MSKRNALLCSGLLTVVFGLLMEVQAQSPEMPAGPMQQKVTTACTECHESRIILQQRLSKAAWAKEVDKMIKWGAVVDAADRDGFIDYLSVNFPPEKPPETMPRAAPAKKP
jgi:hypothetical protein